MTLENGRYYWVRFKGTDKMIIAQWCEVMGYFERCGDEEGFYPSAFDLTVGPLEAGRFNTTEG